MANPRYTCADCGQPTDNYSLICDHCLPDYFDRAQPDGGGNGGDRPQWADETDGDCA